MRLFGVFLLRRVGLAFGAWMVAHYGIGFVAYLVTQFKGGFWSESASVPYSYSLAWSVAIVAFFLPRPHPRMGRAGDIPPGPG